jgi:hypothetical protein
MKNLVRARETGNEARAIRIATVLAPSEAMSETRGHLEYKATLC